MEQQVISVLNQTLDPDFALSYCISAQEENIDMIESTYNRHAAGSSAKLKIINSNPLDCLEDNFSYFIFLN